LSSVIDITEMKQMGRDYIDLHTHSTMSDGTDRPGELVRKAKTAGLRGIALTDHDSLNGVPIAEREARELGLEFLQGIEIGCHDDFGNLHILGYFREMDMEKFDREMEWVKKARIERNVKILERLEDCGIHISMSELRKYAGDDVIGRLHIARAMFGGGHVARMKEAFLDYLNIGGKCFVPRKTFSSSQAVELIKRFGGFVSMAHPFLIPGQKMDLKAIIKILIREGIDAIEVYYVENTPDQTSILEKICDNNDLLRTGGTDYHGENKRGVGLGVGKGEMRIPYSLMENILLRL